METLQNNFTIPNKNFTVAKKHVNNNNALLPSMLYTEMTHFIKNVVSSTNNTSFTTPQLVKLHILKNAFLNDNLLFSGQLKKLNDTEMNIMVLVKQKNKSKNSTVCKAVFSIQLIKNTLIAS